MRGQRRAGLGGKTFSKALDERGFHRDKSNGVRGFRGIELRPQPGGEEPARGQEGAVRAHASTGHLGHFRPLSTVCIFTRVARTRAHTHIRSIWRQVSCAPLGGQPSAAARLLREAHAAGLD